MLEERQIPLIEDDIFGDVCFADIRPRLFVVRDDFVDPMTLERNWFARRQLALTHEPRLAIFLALDIAGPEGLADGAIAQQLGASSSSFSFHLKDLSHARLVNAR